MSVGIALTYILDVFAAAQNKRRDKEECFVILETSKLFDSLVKQILPQDFLFYLRIQNIFLEEFFIRISASRRSWNSI